MLGVGENHMGNFSAQQQQQPAQPVPPPTQEARSEQPAPVEPTTVVEKIQPDPAAEAPQPIEVPRPVEQPKAIELTEEMILEHLKKTRKAEVTSLDELFKKPEPVSDPTEGLSDEALKFLKFNKETGRGLQDYQALNKDYSKISPLDLARESAIKMANGTLSMANVDKYLEKKLGVDLSDPNAIDELDMVDLETFASPYRLKQIEEQAKYSQPIERPKPVAAEATEEMVTLQDGSKISKAKYEQITNQRQAYLMAVKSAADNITSSSHQIEVDDNGTKRTYNLSYDYSKEDKHEMVSRAEDIDNTITNLFGTENGLDHAKLEEGLFWADEAKRGKAISSLIHKALAEQAKDFMKLKNNYNFSTGKKIETGEGQGKPLVIPGTSNNYGVKYNFN
jgi:hypothetical protein